MSTPTTDEIAAAVAAAEHLNIAVFSKSLGKPVSIHRCTSEQAPRPDLKGFYWTEGLYELEPDAPGHGPYTKVELIEAIPA